MARVVYFYRHMSDYIANDLDLLRERHAVTVVECASRWPQPLRVWRLVAGSDVVMAWFASWHSFWPVLIARRLGKPSIVTVGGYDTARMPGIGYGHQRGGVRRRIALATMRMATRLIAISDFTRAEAMALGLPGEKLVRLYLGLDPTRYAGAGVEPGPRVVTVAGVNHSNLTRKGLEPFVRAAALCPGLQFVVVGAWMDGAIDRLREIATANVHFTGRVSHEEKVAWLSRSQVVVQASQHEAFGLSLAEGMLCGCVPVVTRAGSLPEVAGDCGVAIESRSAAAIARGVRAARARWPEAGRAARDRVQSVFDIAHRRRGIQSLIDELVPARACVPVGSAPAIPRPEARVAPPRGLEAAQRAAERNSPTTIAI